MLKTFTKTNLIIFLLAFSGNQSSSYSELVNVIIFYESLCPYSAGLKIFLANIFLFLN